MQLFLDDSNRPLGGVWPLKPVTKTIVFDGATANDPGDFDGTGNPATLFTVSGLVKIQLSAVANVAVSTGSDIVVGVAADDNAIFATVASEALTAGLVWLGGAPAIAPADSGLTIVLVASDIIQTISTANITAGSITYTCHWLPVSSGASVS